MPAGQQYATNVPQATLSTAISTVTTSFGTNSLSSWPTPPFTAVIDIGQSNQEPIDVITVSGNNITSCTRAIDGTTAFSHAINATLTHADIGRDFREARTHMDATSSVHGTTSAVVGINDNQVLTNKTISAGAYTGAQSMGTGAWSGTGSFSENTITGTTLTVNGLTGANGTATRFAGTTAGGPPTSGTFATGDVVYETTYHSQWLCTAGGTPGTWVPLASYQQVGSITPSGVNTASFTLPASLTPYYNNLRIVAAGSTAAAGSDFIGAQFNADTAAHYSWQYSGWLSTNVAKTGVLNSATNILTGALGGNGFNGSTVIDVPLFGSAVALKSLNFTSSAASGIVSSANNFSTQGGGVWNGASAITSITILTLSGSNFNAGTTAYFYLTT